MPVLRQVGNIYTSMKEHHYKVIHKPENIFFCGKSQECKASKIEKYFKRMLEK